MLILSRTYSKSFLTLLLLEPNLNLAELILGLLQPPLQLGDLGSMQVRGQQGRLLIDTYSASLLQLRIDPLSGSPRRTPDNVLGATDYTGFFSFLTSKPVNRPLQASSSPLLAD